MPSSPSARSQQAKIAALTRSSREPSGAAMTERARRKFTDSFYEKTDPALPEAERRRQADAAYRAHMRSIARRPAVMRRKAGDAAEVIATIRAAAAEAADLIKAAAAEAITDALAEAVDNELADQAESPACADAL